MADSLEPPIANKRSVKILSFFLHRIHLNLLLEMGLYLQYKMSQRYPSAYLSFEWLCPSNLFPFLLLLYYALSVQFQMEAAAGLFDHTCLLPHIKHGFSVLLRSPKSP